MITVAMQSLRQVLGDLRKRWTYPVYHRRLRRLAGFVLPFLYQGGGVICPCCEGRFRRFVPRFKNDELCPRCLSLKRHRLLWLYLRDKADLGSKDTFLLHFAPEESIEGRLRALPRLKYITADLNPSSGAMVCTDITRLPFPDNRFDMIICNHVLEHVADDRKAMHELYRVLKPAGRAYMMHPVSALEHTDEDPTVTDRAERRRRFGRHDHVRRYGLDFSQRPRTVGFEVTVEEYFRSLSEDVRSKYVLDTSKIYVCSKLSPRGATPP